MFKISFILIIALLSFYSFYYCPNNLEISFHSRVYNTGKNSIKIAQITDLHTEGVGTIEKKLLATLKKEKPDLIVITGDIATPNGTISGYRDVLTQIKAPLGVYFVNGNWEYWSPIKKIKSLLKENNIEYLNNKIATIGPYLNLVGFDDIEGNPDLKITEQLDMTSLNIGLFHSPVFFKQIPNNIQLSLAGHSHGGQVKLPFIGTLWTPEGTGKFTEGWFKRNESELYVSRGIGNSILPMRFLCRPELVIFNIKY